MPKLTRFNIFIVMLILWAGSFNLYTWHMQRLLKGVEVRIENIKSSCSKKTYEYISHEGQHDI